MNPYNERNRVNGVEIVIRPRRFFVLVHCRCAHRMLFLFIIVHELCAVTHERSVETWLPTGGYLLVYAFTSVSIMYSTYCSKAVIRFGRIHNYKSFGTQRTNARIPSDPLFNVIVDFLANRCSFLLNTLYLRTIL